MIKQIEHGHETSRNKQVLQLIESVVYPEFDPLIPYHRNPTETVSAPIRSQSDLLEAFLEEHQTRTVLLVAGGELTRNLTHICMKYLMVRGSKIHTLEKGGAYVAVIKKARIVFERIDNENGVTVESGESESLQRHLPNLEVSLSSNSDPGQSAIKFNGKNYASNQSGIHAVVLDSFNSVTTHRVFHTGG